MSRSIRVLLILVILLSGCTPKKEDPKDQEVIFPDPIGESVMSPVSIPYVTINPISSINQTISETTELTAILIQIDGLKDDAVESKINTAIQTRFNLMKDLATLDPIPPFRGILLKIQDQATTMVSLYTNLSYNANNVISVLFNAYITVVNPDSSEVYLNLMDSMTFELIHGDQLTLSDFFTDDAQVGSLINDAVVRKLSEMNSLDETGDDYYWGPHLQQVAPFTGIKADQAFFLQDDGLSLIVDYRTPEFDVGFNTMTLTLPYHDFLGKIGITQRFETTQDLYVSEIIDRQFLDLGDPARINEVETLFDQEQFKIRMTTPKSLDASFIEIADSMKQDLIDQLSAYAKTQTVNWLDGTVSAQTIGSYVCLSAYGDAYALSDFFVYNRQECYDKNKHKMTFSDYFVPGFDYEQRLKGVIQNEIDVGYLPDDISVDEVYSNLTMILMSNGFYLAGKAYSPSMGQQQYFGANPLFSVFGVENLTVFDD